MYFAQTNYQEKLGNSNLTIAEAGCFVTADCNLLVDAGQSVAPDTLNAFYLEHGLFSYDLTDHANDDIAWSTVTNYNANIVVKQRKPADGDTWPNDNFAIVKFVYKGHSGAWTTHFCKVHDASKKQVIDSWNGEIITVGAGTYYGEPADWTIYQNNAAPAPATAPAPAAGGVNVGRFLFLPASISSWHVYKPGGPWTVPNAIGTLDPAKFDGLSYQILGSPAANVYLIHTETYGEVAIYAGPDTVAQFFDTDPKAPAPTPAPAPAADPTPVQPENITDVTEDVTITDTLRVRTGPSTQDSQVAIDGAPNGDLQKGDIVAITGYCHGEVIAGNDIWLRSVKGNWFWSGATTFSAAQAETVPTVAAPAPAVATPEVVMPPAEVVADALKPTEAPATTAAQPAETAAPAPSDNVPAYQKTTAAPALYKARNNTAAVDLSGAAGHIEIGKGWIIQAAEELKLNGQTYVRDISAKKKGLWYFIPKNDLMPTGVSVDGMKQFAKDMKQAASDDWDEILNDLKNEGEVFKQPAKLTAEVQTVERDAASILNRFKRK